MPVHQFWLFKTEPSEFSILDLAAAPGQTTAWTGVRNYMARNVLRDKVQLHDRVFVYHSSTDNKGVAGIAQVVREAYPDLTARDTQSDYFDSKATPDNPIWCAVDIKLVETFKGIIPLSLLKQTKGLEKMMVCQRGARLSIQPVSQQEWEIVCRMAQAISVQ